MGPKKHPEAMDIPAQIANLKANNLIIEDEAFAARILQRISYYRLIKAYGLSFKVKKNLRIIKVNHPISDRVSYSKTDGGLLVQSVDNQFSNEFQIVTEMEPTKKQMDDLIFAQKIVKWVKSNAIVVATNGQAFGIGGGQTNRIWAAQQAIERAKRVQTEELVLASDAFFPFRDSVDFAAENGITAIIQPGGSVKDQESIEACTRTSIVSCKS